MNTFKITIITLLLCLLCLPGFAVGESGLDLGRGLLQNEIVVASCLNFQVNADYQIATFTKRFDPQNMFDGVATFTIHTTGYYEVYSSMLFLNHSGSIGGTYFFVNGESTVGFAASDLLGFYNPKAVIWPLNAGDTINFKFLTDDFDTQARGYVRIQRIF